LSCQLFRVQGARLHSKEAAELIAHGRYDTPPPALIILARARLTGNMGVSRTWELERRDSASRPLAGWASHFARFARASQLALAYVWAALTAAATASASKALGDARLQLSVAVRCKKQLGRHTAGIVLGAAGSGARVGIGVAGSKTPDRQDSQCGSPDPFHGLPCSLKHVPPPPHPRAILGG